MIGEMDSVLEPLVKYPNLEVISVILYQVAKLGFRLPLRCWSAVETSKKLKTLGTHEDI